MKVNLARPDSRKWSAAIQRGFGVKQNKAVLANIGVRGIAAVLAFFAQIALVKLLGDVIYGGYVFFVSACSLVFIFSRSGLDVVVLRRASVAYASGNKEGLVDLINKSVGLCIFLSFGWVFVFALLRWTLSKWSPGISQLEPVWIFIGVVSIDDACRVDLCRPRNTQDHPCGRE